MTYAIQRFDCGEWWTFQETDNYVEAVQLKENSYASYIITRIKEVEE